MKEFKCPHCGEVIDNIELNKKRPISAKATNSKTKETLIFDSVSDCAKYFSIEPAHVITYLGKGWKRTHQGIKYLFSYA